VPEYPASGVRTGARPDHGSRARVEVEFEEQTMLGALFGQFDTNLVQIENRLGVFISARGNKVLIEGPEDAVARARTCSKASTSG
jgi:phosphate starvation-inducible PhoH-like protein